MHVLIVSPIPSHPEDQGNSARIATLGRVLQDAGAIVHFLYHPLEGLTPAQRATMARQWDGLHIVPVERMNLAPQADGNHRLDDWYEPKVTAAAAALHARHRYAAVIANYVWFSAVLDAFGPETVKILDTHDVFGGRGDRFRAAGMEPEWFRTTPAEEARGLARADIVLAIQEHEAEIFRALGHPDVRVVGHLRPWRRRPARRAAAPVVIGYLASFNPINRACFQAARTAIAGQGGVAGARLIVAGTICDRLVDPAPFETLGRVEHVDIFYDQVDVVMNPMEWGTGLKIKSVEAVFEGLPLVATRAAMVGLPARHRLHALDDAAALAGALTEVVVNADLRAELAEASVACAEAYGATVRGGVRGVWERIRQGRPGLCPGPAGAQRTPDPMSWSLSRRPSA